MASRPKQQRLNALLAKLAVTELGEDATALDWVCSWIEDGRSINAMHVYVGERFEELSRPWLSRCIHSLGPNAGERIAEARQRGTHVLVEDAQQIADSTSHDTSREAIASAKLRTEILLWRAKAYNRAELGEKAASISISLPQLHLDAMRARNVSLAAVAMLPTSDSEASEVDFSILSDPSSDPVEQGCHRLL